MPHPNQMINGKRRGEWVRDAARALISSTTAATRFLILRGGFYQFQVSSGAHFKEQAGLDFTSSELRWMFEYIARYVLRKERALQPGFEQLYQLHLAKDIVHAPEVDNRDDTIYTENAFGRQSGRDGVVH